MKRLLAYLFIVLGFGLAFNISANGKEINKEFYKFKKILIPLSKDGSWKLIGKKTQFIFSSKLTFIYLAQTKDYQLSKLIELVHVSAAPMLYTEENTTESTIWFNNFLYQKNGFNSCIPKNSNDQQLTLREKYYVYEEPEKSNGCFFTRNIDIEKEILHPTIQRKTKFLDTNHFSRIVKKYINDEIKFPKIMLRSDHYFSSQKELYGYFEMINPDVNGAPNTLFKSEKKSEYHPLNINNHPQKKNFYLTWIKKQAKKHSKFETELKRKNKIDLAKYINYEPIIDLKDNSETKQTVKKKSETTSKKIAKAESTLKPKKINQDNYSYEVKTKGYRTTVGDVVYFKGKSNNSYEEAETKSFRKCRQQTYPHGMTYLCTMCEPCKVYSTKIFNNGVVVNKKTEEKKRKKVKVVEVEEPKQEEFKPKKTNQDNEAPVIEIAEAITVNDSSYEFQGKVTDKAKNIYIEIDGRSVEVKKGKFTVKGYSPVDKQISITAIDQYGNKSQPKLVNIIINQKDTIVADLFETLDPSNIKTESNKDRVALIIGIEKYDQTPEARFANLDAKYFFEYARKAFGVSKSNIKLLVDEDANLIMSLGTINKWLPGKIIDGKTELIIFFAGHGLASNDGKDLYLLPQDSDPDLLTRTALSRKELFKEIIDLNPKSVTMFLDTCYSGVSRDEKTLLASARPVRIVADEQSEVPNNFTIFSASKLDQISSGLKEAKHGIFSYYLMKGLEGKADTNQDKQITNGELLAYMDQNVSQKASELGRQQNPSLAGDPDKVLMSYR